MTQTELYQKLTGLMPDRKVPTYWDYTTAVSLVGIYIAGPEPGDEVQEGDWLEPDLSQLLQLIEMEGYWFEVGKDADGYYCRILRLPEGFTIYVEWERFFGLTLEYAATLAAIAVLTRKEKT